MGVRTVAAAVVGFCTLVLGSAAPLGAATVDEAYRLFYASRFEESAAAAAELTAANPGDLVAWEIRTSALHFQLKRLVGEGKDKKGAFARCAECPKLLSTFIEEVGTRVWHFDRGRIVDFKGTFEEYEASVRQ